MESTKPTKSSVQFHPFILLGLNIQQEQLMHPLWEYSIGKASNYPSYSNQKQLQLIYLEQQQLDMQKNLRHR